MRPLVVMALASESWGSFERAGVDVLFTGVGKINAAHALTRRLTEIRCSGRPLPHVVNFGTADSHTLAPGTLIACSTFHQRDMDAAALGFEPGATPFDRLPRIIELPATVHDLPDHTCSSGDSFESGVPTTRYDVIDMEAYALARVCVLEGAPFTCIKYITDRADDSAAQSWRASLPKAAEEFFRIFRSLSLSNAQRAVSSF